MTSEKEIVTLLRSKGLRVTPERVKLLLYLGKVKRPQSADELHKSVKGDLVTIYRNLQTFVHTRLVREMRFRNAIAQYEFADGEHHHHLVCTSCGVIAELPECEVKNLDKKVLKSARDFASVDEHTLEFFGVCKSCTSP